MKGYKVFNPDWTCRNFQYEVGGTYEENVEPKTCDRGFHFCKQAVDCFNYYSFDPNNKVAEVEAIGDIHEDGDKCATNKIKIIREIQWMELLNIVNTGKGNSGLGNTGHYNTGHYNTGNRNTGNRNTGNRNTGNRNTGNRNTGHYCTGDFNISDSETGCFNTEEHTIRIFDVDSKMTFAEWRGSRFYRLLEMVEFVPTTWVAENKMTTKEKSEHPEHKTAGGYLRKNDASGAFLEWWDKLNMSEKEIIKSIPNFNAEKFKLITGIQV